ncbi:MAG: AAA family ATPase [Byssovorax sp.]
MVDAAIADTLAIRGNGAVVGIAPAGAGKSYAIATAVERARAEKMRVAVVTPTNEQAFALVRDLGERLKTDQISYVHSATVLMPSDCARRNVTEKKAKEVARDGLVVGTLSKLGDAHARGDLTPFDLLLIDEAYQANAVHYYGVGDLAPRHLLMGDSGQLAPFTTAPEPDRWRGLSEDPLLTAVEVLLLNHTKTKRHYLPISRRLDPRAIPVARSFYPDHVFEAAVLPGVRKLILESASGRNFRDQDAALEKASTAGWAHVELPDAAVLTTDPRAIWFIVSTIQRLFKRKPRVHCENHPKGRALEQADVAVAVSHNDQKDLLRAELADAGFPDVRVNTANKLQGLTFEVVIAWHPLSGLVEGDAFHLDPGRLCVMLTRHRQACIVLGRAADRRLVEGIPPSTPSYVGWDVNPALDGWYAHEAVFSALDPFRITARV